jgi:kinesin family member 1
MPFSFDKSYWSVELRDDPGYFSQQTLYNDLKKGSLDHGFAGFNACILACQYLDSTSPSSSIMLIYALDS